MKLFNNPVSNFVIRAGAAYAVVKIVGLALMLSLVSIWVLHGHYQAYTENVAKYEIIDTPLVKFTSRNCTVVYNPASEEFIHMSNGFNIDEPINCQEGDSLVDVVDEHHSDVRGMNDRSNFWVFGGAFVMFMIAAWLINPTIGYTFGGMAKTLATWIVISVFLFPLTFLDYKATSTQTVNGVEYSVSDGLMTKSGQWVNAPITYVGKLTTVSVRTPTDI